MPADVLDTADSQASAMAGKDRDKKPPTRQLNFRCPETLIADLERIKNGLGLTDLANVIRMVLREHVPEYLRRVDAIEAQHQRPKRER